MEHCYLCHADAPVVTNPRKFKVPGARAVTIQDTAYQCVRCGEAFYGGGMMDESLRRVAAAVRLRDGLLGPEELISLRESLHHTQARMGEILGVDEELISKWEQGMFPQPAKVDRAYRRLRGDPRGEHAGLRSREAA